VALKITFVKSGTNSEHAVTGKVTLLDGATKVIEADGFSGGNNYNPLDDGTYHLRLDIRGDEGTNEANTDGTLKPFYGIQKVGTKVVDAEGVSWNMQVEWGTLRARLNPTGGAPDHGDYLHGKQRARDWTHGCICERSEAISKYLWNLAAPPKIIDVVVSGGHKFDLEVLVRKNAASSKKHASKTAKKSMKIKRTTRKRT
jgi:hypothetical protein